MSLARKAIRARVRELLVGATAAGDRVHTNRVRRLWPTQGLPALVVYTLEEGPPTYPGEGVWTILHRDLRLGVELVVTEADGIPDDLVDDLAHQVEAAILCGPRFLGLDAVVRLRLEGVQIGFDAQGERLFGAARIVFALTYEQELTADPSLLAPWIVAHTTWDLPPPDGTAEAVDHQELPQ